MGKALELIEEDAGSFITLLGVVVQDVVVHRLELLVCWDEQGGQDSQRDADCWKKEVSGQRRNQSTKGGGERTRREQPEDPLPVDLQEGTSEDEPKDVRYLSAGAKRRKGNVLLVLAREEVDDDVQSARNAAGRTDTLDSP